MFDQKHIRTGLTYAFIAALLAVVLLPLPDVGGSFTGHVLGILGTAIMFLALIYTFRKRVLGHKGKNNPISHHTLWGLIGPTLVVFHTGGEFSSLIGRLVFLCMVIVVFSGIVGIYLFRKTRKTLNEHKQELSQLQKIFFAKKKGVSSSNLEQYLQAEDFVENIDSELIGATIEPTEIRHIKDLEQLAGLIADTEHTIKFYSTIERIFSRWSRAHIALVFFLFAFLGSHIATMIYYGLRWL